MDSIVNARDYGVPQNRERPCISELNGEKKFEFPKPIKLKFKLYDILEENVDERYYLRNGQVMDRPIEQEYSLLLTIQTIGKELHLNLSWKNIGGN